MKTVQEEPDSNMFRLLLRYAKYSAALVVFTVLSNGLGLVMPKLVAAGIDAYAATHKLPVPVLVGFLVSTVGIFLFATAQEIMQVVASERIARDLRCDLIAKISRQNNSTVQHLTPATLLTNLTSDINSVKMFIGLAVSIMIANIFMVIGSSILLLLTNLRLGLIVLMIIPVVAITFGTVMGKVRQLFGRGQQVIDRLNKVINESILGVGLIRILNSQSREDEKFASVNRSASEIGLKILGYFSSLLPVITLTGSLAILAILVLGGKFVIMRQMSLGNFIAFNSYVGLLIFPIITVGFMSNIIVRATASYGRIMAVFTTPDPVESGTVKADTIKGDIEFRHISLSIGDKSILKDISFSIKAGTRTAIIGPTAAGKSQIFSLITGLSEPTEGSITFDGRDLGDYVRPSLFARMGVVFQQSTVFRMSLRENIAFSDGVTERELQKAVATARLQDYVDNQPDKLDSMVSERGTSLSGGQKQRLMLARALARNPKILLLDDFTARVDMKTEQQILANVREQYPDITLISITQKIDSVKDYDQIIVLMEGELIGKGTHKQLLRDVPEYMQMYESQKSTNHYEIQIT